MTTTDSKKLNRTGLIHLGIVYLVWSSTYLAIRIGVREGSGFPPFTLGAYRMLISGLILMIWVWLAKSQIKPKRKDLVILAVSGTLLIVGGNGLVMLGEQHADSSLAALMVAAVPIWTAVIEALIDRKKPSMFFVGALLTGFAGIGLLVTPSLMSGVEADLKSIIAFAIAPISWSIGTVLQTRRPVELGPRTSSAYQMLFGGIGFVILMLVTNEPTPTPTPDAVWALVFLIIFGSVLAFTSFINALQLLPTKIVMTYPYVNPVLATVLGYFILSEPITTWTVGGMFLVLLGVWGVFRDKQQEDKD